jgi:hypothetical protein
VEEFFRVPQEAGYEQGGPGVSRLYSNRIKIAVIAEAPAKGNVDVEGISPGL